VLALIFLLLVLVAHHHRRHREAVTEALAEGQHVRHDVPVVHAEHLAGAAHAGEDLVGKQQDAAVGAELAQALHEAIGRHGRARPALNRLQHDRRHPPGGLFLDDQCA